MRAERMLLRNSYFYAGKGVWTQPDVIKMDDSGKGSRGERQKESGSVLQLKETDTTEKEQRR